MPSWDLVDVFPCWAWPCLMDPSCWGRRVLERSIQHRTRIIVSVTSLDIEIQVMGQVPGQVARGGCGTQNREGRARIISQSRLDLIARVSRTGGKSARIASRSRWAIEALEALEQAVANNPRKPRQPTPCHEPDHQVVALRPAMINPRVYTNARGCWKSLRRQAESLERNVHIPPPWTLVNVRYLDHHSPRLLM